MTDEEKKAWEGLVSICNGEPGMTPLDPSIITAANDEIVRLWEAVEWALDRRVWNHQQHPPDDHEWEYFEAELLRRAGGRPR